MSYPLKKLLIILGMIFIAWVLFITVSVHTLFQTSYGWFSFCGGILSFILSAISMLLWKSDTNRDTTEINSIPLIFTSVYFAVTLLSNTVFCFLCNENYSLSVPIAVNALLTIVFVAVRMFVLPYRNRVLRTAAHTTEKTRGVIELSAKLGEILGIAQDETVKQRLMALKEQLDYSTNVSQPFTVDIEALFFNQLCDILTAIEQQAPAEDVLAKIDAAQITWKRRNGASSVN